MRQPKYVNGNAQFLSEIKVTRIAYKSSCEVSSGRKVYTKLQKEQTARCGGARPMNATPRELTCELSMSCPTFKTNINIFL